MYLTIQLNLSLFLMYGCEIWGGGGGLIQLQQDLEMEQ